MSIALCSSDPPLDCQICPRLAAFRAKNRIKFPDKFNAPVPSFGGKDAQLLIAGLAPGLKGANFTGRPFTGDYAGYLLYNTLAKFGFSSGTFSDDGHDDLVLKNCRITNAVRCVPPQNKPTGDEIKNCQRFLKQLLGEMQRLKVIVSLGKIAHDAVLRTYGHRLSAFKFAHMGLHQVSSDVVLLNSYHCSRYNTQTNRLTTEMFEDVFVKATEMIAA